MTQGSARTIKYRWNAKGTGDLEQVTDGSTVTDFKYGTAGQLATAKTGSVTTTYTFDAAGRRTGWKSPTASQECTWTGDDLLTGWAKKTSTGSVVASAVYDHDGDGQRISASVLATSPWSATPTTTAYAYGWEGMSLCWQTARSAGAEARLTYLYDETDRAYAASYEATVSGTATSSVIRIMSNDHGDVVGLADASGEVFARYVYGPFGEAERTYSRATPRISAALAAQITSANPIRYAGYDYDSWAGTYYLQARHYDPATKQFLSKDPADADGEESSYQYCSGDPIGLVDPSGMWGISLGGLWRRACRTVKRAYRATVRRVNRAVNCVKRVVRTAYRAAKRVVKRIVRAAKRWVRHTVRNVRRGYHAFKKRFTPKKRYNGERPKRGASKRAWKRYTDYSAREAESSLKWANFWDNTAKGATVLAAVCIGVPLLYFTAGAGGPVLASYLMAHGGAIGGGLVGGGASAAAVNELSDGDDDEVRGGQAVQRLLSKAGSGACFVRGTLVRTAAGLVPIEAVRAGDRVLARDEKTGRQGYKRVVHTVVRQVMQLVHIRTRATTITASVDHPFYVVGRGWVEAGELTEGETLYFASGDTGDIESITHEELVRPVDVFNFEVEGYHTYFVGGCSVWVHNNPCAERPVHGNSLDSPRTSYLYRLSSTAGQYLKTGISQNPLGRYSKAFMADKNMAIISEGTRRGMIALERCIVEVDPGILNREPWARR